MKKDLIIKLENIWKSYQAGSVETKVLQGIDLEINRGSFVSIIGSSGSGKSTLLNIVGLLDIPDRGKMYIDGKDTSTFSLNQLADVRGRKLGFVFQQFNLIQHLSALGNIVLPMIFQGVNEKKTAQRTKELLVSVGLEDKINNRPSELSGGEQQRVAIARSLVNNPEIILADEPTGNLDSKTGKIVMEILKKLHDQEKRTVIVVTHDDYVASYSDKSIYIKDGRIVKKHDKSI